MKFSEWKLKAMIRLIELTKKYEGNQKVVSDLNTVITKLHYAKQRDLSTILYYLYVIARDDGVREVLDLVPSEAEALSMGEE